MDTELINKSNNLITILPTIKPLNYQNLFLLIRDKIPFETHLCKYEGLNGLDNTHLLVDKLNRKVFLFDDNNAPLTDYYVIGSCNLDDYNYYKEKAEYPPKPMDELFKIIEFDTFNEELVYIVNYIMLLEQEGQKYA